VISSDDDELFPTEGGSKNVTVEGQGNVPQQPVQTQTEERPIAASIDMVEDAMDSDYVNPELTAALADLGLSVDDNANGANENQQFAELFEQRIAKVRSMTADISEQLTIISPPQSAEADNSEEL
jgi:hypothetical protein